MGAKEAVTMVILLKLEFKDIYKIYRKLLTDR